MKLSTAILIAIVSYSQLAAAEPGPARLQQLVAPIALYPDALVAQVLAASTYPGQVVQADRWMQGHAKLKTDQLAREVDKQPWDPSVRALAQFPSVLTNMDKNLSWTTALGDAYANQQQAVLDAVQAMRRRARSAGNLQSTPQQTVSSEGQIIVIQPASPELVYVPAYDPWATYGAPLMVYPGWAPFEGGLIGAPGISFGIGFGVGYFGGFGWGWHHWDCDWRDRRVIYNRNTYVTQSRTFLHRGDFHREPGGFDRNRSDMRAGTSRGFAHGPITRGSPVAGRSSLGGFHGGFRGGFHGSFHGSFHGGGVHR
jgi:hypothetical protein